MPVKIYKQSSLHILLHYSIIFQGDSIKKANANSTFTLAKTPEHVFHPCTASGTRPEIKHHSVGSYSLDDLGGACSLNPTPPPYSLPRLGHTPAALPLCPTLLLVPLPSPSPTLRPSTQPFTPPLPSCPPLPFLL